MSLRHLVEPECGGENTLMRVGGHITRDSAFKDEGLGSRSIPEFGSGLDHEGHKFVNEYLGQFGQPQTFKMDSLLQEMREMDIHNARLNVVNAPRVIEEVSKGANWTNEFVSTTPSHSSVDHHQNFNELWNHSAQIRDGQHVHHNETWINDFFGSEQTNTRENELFNNVFPVQIPAPVHGLTSGQFLINNEEIDETSKFKDGWVEDFESFKEKSNDLNDPQSEASKTEDYNKKFWSKLQDEWKRISEESSGDHPWLTEFSDYYDPYKEYSFTENNPMLEDKDALAKGKAFLAKGDIPSAVLCFESAVKQEPQNAEAWELLGVSQAENEMDPNAITALKKCLEINPNNPKVFMALAISYTNESLQSHALRMLIKWLQSNAKYQHLIPANFMEIEESGAVASSLIRGPELKETQEIFLQAVKLNPQEIDADVQEALGVLFNLSSEYDKAADCFKAALHVKPDSAKIWNRLGASLANGNRAVEAVDAYQKALSIEPGYIRARYNVGIICMTLKAYKEAAGHLLTALNLQASSSARSGLKVANLDSTNHMSDTIWSTFRMIVSLMGRKDLQEVMDRRDLNALNQAFEDS